ncbi:acyloxyacyl hydrolase [Polaribacter sp.]|uniref:acyloxyacyl hydrolase n=1 Tax=Polaribacter sp. TaxID=1920175 RepID=UPI003EF95E4D
MQKILFTFFTFMVFSSFAQEKNKSFLHPDKIGFLYNTARNENFLYNDLDYTYTSSTFKTQAFYTLKNWKSFDLELIVQPQIQFLKHQLLNESFVLPSEEDYQQKRAEFTKLKNMHLYALEFAIGIKKELFTKLSANASFGLGLSYIDTRSERLAKGFTFIENLSLGLSYQTTKKTFLLVGTNLGHVSNAELKQPNSGYNALGLEIGFSYILD